MGSFGGFLKVVVFFALGYMATLVALMLIEASLGISTSTPNGNTPVSLVNAAISLVVGIVVVRRAVRRGR